MKALPDEPLPSGRRDPLAVRKKKGFEQQEAALVDALGGKPTPASGAGRLPSRKSDAVSATHRGEAKTTDKKTLAIKHEWLWKIRAEAHATKKIASFMFGFDEVKTETHLLQGREDWIAFPSEVGKAMLRAIEALEKGDLETAKAWARRTIV